MIRVGHNQDPPSNHSRLFFEYYSFAPTFFFLLKEERDCDTKTNQIPTPFRDMSLNKAKESV